MQERRPAAPSQCETVCSTRGGPVDEKLDLLPQNNGDLIGESVSKKKRLPPWKLNRIHCMPVKYQVDKANRIIRTRCTGPVTIEEVVGHFRVLERDPDCPDRVDVLLDLSEETWYRKKRISRKSLAKSGGFEAEFSLVPVPS
jgi:hypothetical protein